MRVEQSAGILLGAEFAQTDQADSFLAAGQRLFPERARRARQAVERERDIDELQPALRHEANQWRKAAGGRGHRATLHSRDC